MNANRLFRTIWRINGVALLLAFVLLAGAALVGTASAIWRSSAHRSEGAAIGAAGEERFSFGDVREIEGTAEVVIPLHSRHPYGGGSSGPFSSGGNELTIRNLLFYDAAAGSSRWLRPDHRGVVVAWEPLRDGAAEKGPVRFIRYEIADADTDGDGEITDNDTRRVAISGPGGEGFTVIVPDADAIHGYAPPRNGTLLVFFRRGAEDLVGEVDLAARTLRKTTRLPKS